MKKIFTLIVALTTLGSVFAQKGGHYDYNNNRQYAVTNPHNDSYSFRKERDRQLERINQDFDKQIKAVQRNRFLKPYEKERQVRILEAQRGQKLQEVGDRFSDHPVSYNNRSNNRW